MLLPVFIIGVLVGCGIGWASAVYFIAEAIKQGKIGRR
jgi:hypothetical protein